MFAQDDKSEVGQVDCELKCDYFKFLLLKVLISWISVNRVDEVLTINLDFQCKCIVKRSSFRGCLGNSVVLNKYLQMLAGIDYLLDLL